MQPVCHPDRAGGAVEKLRKERNSKPYFESMILKWDCRSLLFYIVNSALRLESDIIEKTSRSIIKFNILLSFPSE